MSGIAGGGGIEWVSSDGGGRVTDILDLSHLVHLPRVLVTFQFILHELRRIIDVFVLQLPLVAHETLVLLHDGSDQREGDPGRVLLIHRDCDGEPIVAHVAVTAVRTVIERNRHPFPECTFLFVHPVKWNMEERS